MKILIATGIYPPDVGGPAKYAKSLAETLSTLGHEVRVLPYRLEKRLPWGIRQFFYLTRIFFTTPKIDTIIALDTISVGFPAVVSSFLWGKKVIIRTGGDFLWETYLERSGIKVPLPDFYEAMPALSFKEKVIAKIHQFVLDYTDFIVFSTAWQKEIWAGFYVMNLRKVRIIENCYYAKRRGEEPKERVFLAAARQIAMKNFSNIEAGFQRAESKLSGIKLDRGAYTPDEYEKKLKTCYAVVVVSLGDISPNSIMEAISYNKPFILTKYNGIQNRLNGAGVIVDPNDIDDIARGFIDLADAKKYQEEKDKIKQISFKHGFEDIAKEFIKIFEEQV